MILSIVDNCNIVLKKFGFPQTIKTITSGDISIVNTGKTVVIQGNAVVIPEPYFWYYLNINSEQGWNFLCGSANKKRVYKWTAGNRKNQLSKKFIKGIKKEVNHKIADIRLGNLGGAIC